MKRGIEDLLMCTKIQQRNLGIDFIKYIGAFMVICIHSSSPGIAMIKPFTRFAVPVFFMITGYYTQQREHVCKQLRKAVTLFLSCNALYFGYQLLQNIGSWVGYFMWLANAKAWVEFLLFNQSPFWGHLWYLGAHLYVLWIIHRVDERIGRRKIYFLIPVLLTFNLILGNYSFLLFRQAFPTCVSRNFLFTGLPFFLLGDYIRRNGSALSNSKLMMGIVLSAVGTHLENMLLPEDEMLFTKDLFISTVFLSYFLFVYVIRNEKLFSNRLLSFVATLGKRYSLSIYVFHLMIQSILSDFVNSVGSRFPEAAVIYECGEPIILLVVSTIFAWILDIVTKRIKASQMQSV